MQNIALICLCILITVNAEVFSSIAKMELLVETQKIITENLNKLMKTKNIQNTVLKNQLQRFDVENKKAMMNIKEYVGNPMNCFRLIKRLLIDFKVIEDNVVLTNESAVLIEKETFTFPTSSDLEGSAESWYRLEQMYGLDIEEIASGIWHTSYGSIGKFIDEFSPMTISDCIELGKAMYKCNHHKAGIEWLKIALRKLNDEKYKYPEDENITLNDIHSEILNGYKGHRTVIKKYNSWYKKTTAKMPKITQLNKTAAMSCFANGLSPSEVVENMNTKKEAIDFLDLNGNVDNLCKGIKKGDTTKNNDAKCYLAHGPHPFLKLAPIKAEMLDPLPVILFYDVIHDFEINYIKSLVLPKLNRSLVGLGKGKVEIARVSQTAKANNNDTIVKRVRARIEEFTGLELSFSEPLQIGNYGIGGRYLGHHDATEHWSNVTRYATALLYLSDVEQGGATVFPKLGLSVFPMKGAALFWLNLLGSGDGNQLAFHAACPVLWGSKWVATQWVLGRGQELTHPCRFDDKAYSP